MTAPADWFELPLPEATGHDVTAGHHAALAEKRRERPLERMSPFGADGPVLHMAYRYDDVAAVLRDSERFSLDVVQQRYRAVLGSSFLTAAPRVRRALRRLLRERIRPDDPAVAGLIERVVAVRVAALGEPTSAVDLIDALAVEVPARVMTRLLGLPDHQWRTIAELSAATAGLLRDPRGAVRAARALRKRFTAALAERRADPSDDLISALLAIEVDGQPLDEAELTSSLLLLTWAGTETAGPAIANTLYALLTHPEHADAARAEPDRLPAAVDEALRWETPVQLTARRVCGGAELAGTRLGDGALVVAHLGSANRDPERYEHPDTYDPARTAGRQLAFGHGPHHCLGEALARSEIAGCVRVLLERFPAIGLAAGAPAPEGAVLRCPRELPVWLR